MIKGLITSLVNPEFGYIYRDEIYSLQILLSRTQAGPGRAVKQEQEEISPNHVQRINLISVFGTHCQVSYSKKRY